MAPKQPKSERDTARLLPDKVERSIALPADEFSDSNLHGVSRMATGSRYTLILFFH